MTQAYRNQMQPYAQKAASALGYAPAAAAAILVQWENESGSGTSSLAKQHNNHGGIKFSQYSSTAQKISGSDFAHYASIDAFVTDYVRVLKLSYYNDVRKAGATGNVEATLRALGASPYDAGHYALNGVQGGKLLNALGLGTGKPEPSKPAAATCPHCNKAVYLRSE